METINIPFFYKINHENDIYKNISVTFSLFSDSWSMREKNIYETILNDCFIRENDIIFIFPVTFPPFF